jgi:hypothetical protein
MATSYRSRRPRQLTIRLVFGKHLAGLEEAVDQWAAIPGTGKGSRPVPCPVPELLPVEGVSARSKAV